MWMNYWTLWRHMSHDWSSNNEDRISNMSSRQIMSCFHQEFWFKLTWRYKGKFRHDISFNIINQLSVFTCSFEELLWWMNTCLLKFHACIITKKKNPQVSLTDSIGLVKDVQRFPQREWRSLSDRSRRRRGTRLVNVQSRCQALAGITARLLAFHASMES